MAPHTSGGRLDVALRRWLDAMAMRSHDDAGVPADASGGGGGSGSVLVTTIHQAKGLEWPVVYLPFMTEGSLPLLPACLPPHSKEMLEHIEEERRIAYVGFTRARHQLVLSWSDVVGPDGGGAAAGGNKENTAAAAAAPAKRSRFLFGLHDCRRERCHLRCPPRRRRAPPAAERHDRKESRRDDPCEA